MSPTGSCYDINDWIHTYSSKVWFYPTLSEVGTHDLMIKHTYSITYDDTTTYQEVFDPSSFTVTVDAGTAVNNACSFSPADFAVPLVINALSPFCFSLPLAVDPDGGDVLTYSVTADSFITWNPGTPCLDVFPTLSDVGLASVTFTATDDDPNFTGTQQSCSHTFSINVVGISNSAPVFVEPANVVATINAGSTYVINISNYDPDYLDSLTYSMEYWLNGAFMLNICGTIYC